MKKLNKIIFLPYKNKRLILESLYYLIIYSIAIKTKRLQPLFQRVHKKALTRSNKSKQYFSPNTICKYLEAGGKIIPRSTCLSIALAGQDIFSKYGYVTNLHIGVLKNDQLTIEAHAWLSLNDKIILGNTPNLNLYHEFPLQIHGVTP